MPDVQHRPTDVAVVGAGAIGTAVAWRCAQRGLSVALVDPEPQRGAWHTAAGMLAPITELHYTESALLRLNLDSAARFPAFAAELTDATGLPTGYLECGTVEIAWDAADLRALRDLHAFGAALGLAGQLLTSRELRALEPSLAAGIPGGLLAEFDHQVDPRLLHAAQFEAARRAGVTVHRLAARIDVRHDRAAGVELADGTRLAAGRVVLAAGAWSSRLHPVPVRPVKGQTVRLRMPAGSGPRRVVRATVRGSAVYVVPRGDGRIVLVSPRAGAVYELLRDGQTVLPELGDAVLEEVSTGLRPGSADNAPLIGPAPVDRLVYATGHYRNGILLSPVTADAVAQLVAEGTVPDAVAPFAPSRDAGVPA
jgi:glycine oxidase